MEWWGPKISSCFLYWECTGTDRGQEIDGITWLNCTPVPRWWLWDPRGLGLILHTEFGKWICPLIWHWDRFVDTCPVIRNEKTQSKSILFSCYKVLYKLLWTHNVVRRVRGKHVFLSSYGNLDLWIPTPHLVRYNAPGDLSRPSHNPPLLIYKPEFVTCHPHVVRFNQPLARSVWCVHQNWGLLCQSIPIWSRGSGGYPQPPGAYGSVQSPREVLCTSSQFAKRVLTYIL